MFKNHRVGSRYSRHKNFGQLPAKGEIRALINTDFTLFAGLRTHEYLVRITKQERKRQVKGLDERFAEPLSLFGSQSIYRYAGLRLRIVVIFDEAVIVVAFANNYRVSEEVVGRAMNLVGAPHHQPPPVAPRKSHVPTIMLA